MFLPQVVGCDYVDVDGEDVYPRTAIVGYINGTPAPWVAFVNAYMAGGIANARIDHRDRSADLQRVRRFPPAPRRNPASRSVPTLSSPPSLSSIVPFLFFAPPHPPASSHCSTAAVLPHPCEKWFASIDPPLVLQVHIHKALFTHLQRAKIPPSRALRAAVRANLAFANVAAALIEGHIPVVLHDGAVTQMRGQSCIFCDRITFESSRPHQWTDMECCWCLLPLPL